MTRFAATSALLLSAVASSFAMDVPDVTSGFIQAEATERHLFVFVRTDWCSWCKKMMRETLPDSAVAGLLDTRFVWTTFNPEADGPVYVGERAMTAAEFAGAYGATAFPTSLFFEPDGTFVGRLPGFVPAREFAEILRYVAEYQYRTR